MKEEDRFTNFFYDARNDPSYNAKQLRGHYPGCADVLHRHFSGQTMLEVGGGMGWITKHLQDYGEDCMGFDIGEHAVNNAVCNNYYHSDMMDCINWNRKWDLVFSINSMAYLEEEEVPIALKSLKHVTGKTLFILLQTWQNFVIRSGYVPKKFKFDAKNVFGGFRRTIQTRDWWLERMFEVGFDLDWDLYKKIKFDNVGFPASDFRGGGLGWRGLDSLFIMKAIK